LSRVPLPYNPKIIELFKNPKNAGRMEDATIVATVGSPICGDMVVIYLKINEKDEIIEKATFESYGCAANIATASILTEMIKGRKLVDVWKIGWKDVAKEIGGLPSVKAHCGILATGALKKAIREYYAKKGFMPKWLPKELTVEEKHVLEEEKLAEALSKKVKI